MLAKVDEKLLWLANQFVKKFNWLTGKDNFFLAHVVSFFIGFFFFLVWGVEKKAWWAIFAAVFSTGSLYFLVYRWESLAERERKAGVKNILDFRMLVFSRRSSLITTLFILFLRLSSLGQPQASFSNLYLPFFLLIYLFWTFFWYLLSVDKPPYSRSRAWELLRGKIRAFFTPVPVSVPVPVSAD